MKNYTKTKKDGIEELIEKGWSADEAKTIMNHSLDYKAYLESDFTDYYAFLESCD